MILVFIGPKWLEAGDRHNRRRIEQADDWVRQEIELARDQTVIPIVFGGAGIPSEKDLPDPISYLASRQGVSVRDEFAQADLQPVLLAIEQRLPSAGIRGLLDHVGGDGRHLPYPQPPLIIKPAPMAEDDINIAIQELLPDWDVVVSQLPENPDQRRTELHRTFLFRSFRDVLAFMNEVGNFADNANHHPRWENIYETLRVYLTTWDIGHHISQLDLQLAQYFDRAFQQYQASSPGRGPE